MEGDVHPELGKGRSMRTLVRLGIAAALMLLLAAASWASYFVGFHEGLGKKILFEQLSNRSKLQSAIQHSVKATLKPKRAF